MWWQLVIGTPHKTFDNFHSQKKKQTFRRAMMVSLDQLYVTLILPRQICSNSLIHENNFILFIILFLHSP